MFTGIISRKASVIGTSDKLGVKKITIPRLTGDKMVLGESVSINGVCSTVAELTDNFFAVEYMSETLKRTTMEGILADHTVNLERSIKAGDPLDGHFVYGHVDSIAVIDRIKNDGLSKIFCISIPKEFHKYIAYKGSVAIDGVSLTISEVTKSGFEVALIPYTLTNTTLGIKKGGDMVNVETDIIARYLEKLSISN